jgi:hypothetical protein
MPCYTFEMVDDEGDEIQVTLPGKYEVCPRCEGTGTHDHPAFENGITSSEWAEWDDDDREHYMRGHYDVQCSRCKGLRVVCCPDEECLTAEQKQQLEQHRADQYAEAQERAWERRNRALGIEY